MTHVFHELYNEITNIIKFAVARDETIDWTFDDASIKATEEIGELSEVILILTGRLPHKSLKEHHLSEIADNINEYIDMISFSFEHYPSQLLSLDMLESSLSNTFDSLSILSIQELNSEILKYYKNIRTSLFSVIEGNINIIKFNANIMIILKLGIALDILVSTTKNTKPTCLVSVISNISSILNTKLKKWEGINEMKLIS